MRKLFKYTGCCLLLLSVLSVSGCAYTLGYTLGSAVSFATHPSALASL